VSPKDDSGSDRRSAQRDGIPVWPWPIEGLAEIAAAYDALIVDQFGVLHDGHRAYDGSRECVQRLHAAGKRMVVLSNSGRRAAENGDRLVTLGFPVAMFEAVITSGEVAWRALRERGDSFHRGLGDRCLLIAENDDDSFLQGLDLLRADSATDADFLLVVGIDTPQRALADYEPPLREGARRGLPLLCANGDLVRLTRFGLQPAPGALARRYAELGGEVHGYGKPLAPIFEQSLAALPGIARERVVVVGDSLEHDVVGACGVGLHSVYVRGGIDAGAGRCVDPSAGACVPRYVVDRFQW
jgi:HAD superfamily hydrolase (TIGR01459 family)